MLKALVIDDEPSTLFMFNLFLEAYGYEVITAENGAAGIEMFKKERPSIVFTDIKMPGVDGLDILKLIKSIDPAVQVIVMTTSLSSGRNWKKCSKRRWITCLQRNEPY
jgi:YesN/AraC family two-component response regulator